MRLYAEGLHIALLQLLPKVGIMHYEISRYLLFSQWQMTFTISHNLTRHFFNFFPQHFGPHFVSIWPTFHSTHSIVTFALKIMSVRIQSTHCAVPRVAQCLVDAGVWLVSRSGQVRILTA